MQETKGLKTQVAHREERAGEIERREEKMDFSPVKEARFEDLGRICDELMLQVAAQGIAFQEEWPYAIHILGHLYANDVNSARFLWKNIPAVIKENRPEVVAAWKIGQQLWTRNYSGVHEAIHGFDWTPEAKAIVTAFSELYTKKMFELLSSAYSTISVGDTALFLGISEDDAINYAQQGGWSVDLGSRMLTVKKAHVKTEQKLDPTKLQRLTEYVFHLEH